MSKLITLLCIFIILLTIVGCKKKPNNPDKTNSSDANSDTSNTNSDNESYDIEFNEDNFLELPFGDNPIELPDIEF